MTKKFLIVSVMFAIVRAEAMNQLLHRNINAVENIEEVKFQEGQLLLQAPAAEAMQDEFVDPAVQFGHDLAMDYLNYQGNRIFMNDNAAAYLAGRRERPRVTRQQCRKCLQESCCLAALSCGIVAGMAVGIGPRGFQDGLFMRTMRRIAGLPE